MARKHPLHCPRDTKRFTVVRVNNKPFDSHSGRSFERAMELAMPDRGSKIDVFVVCAGDAGEARMPYAYEKRGKLVRSFRYKRG